MVRKSKYMCYSTTLLKKYFQRFIQLFFKKYLFTFYFFDNMLNTHRKLEFYMFYKIMYIKRKK